MTRGMTSLTNMSNKKIIIWGIALGLVLLPNLAKAYTLQQLTIDESNDFVLGPGKTELFLDPGDQVVQELYITNRFKESREFHIEVEDFTGSDDASEVVKLLGKEKGPFSLKDFLKPELTTFTLKPAERIILSVTIAIPDNATPGGLYGSILVTTNPPRDSLAFEEGMAASQMKLITRLGTLFFIRVKGAVNEDGELEAVKMGFPGKGFYEKGPVRFQLLFRNRGSVHLTPFGMIDINNILGKKIGQIEVDPWFAMPGSLRSREVEWNKEALFGRYQAVALINRGYSGLIDEKSVTFWVIPWKPLGIVIIIIGVIIWVLMNLKKKFRFSFNVSVKSPPAQKKNELNKETISE